MYYYYYHNYYNYYNYNYYNYYLFIIIIYRTIPFLDILIKRHNHTFSTSIYRKKTFTGLYTKWDGTPSHLGNTK